MSGIESNGIQIVRDAEILANRLNQTDARTVRALIDAFIIASAEVARMSAVFQQFLALEGKE